MIDDLFPAQIGTVEKNLCRDDCWLHVDLIHKFMFIGFDLAIFCKRLHNELENHHAINGKTIGKP